MFTATLEGEAEFYAQVHQFAAELQRGAERAVTAACKSGVDSAKRGAFKDRTGDLRGKITGGLVSSPTGGGANGVIESPMNYSSYVEAGTEPHVIAARRKKFLHWKDAGGDHFARSVQHPGTRSIPFMGPAYIAAERTLQARMEAEAVEAGKVFK